MSKLVKDERFYRIRADEQEKRLREIETKFQRVEYERNSYEDKYKSNIERLAAK
jgi:hypothetical protein